MSDGKNLGKRGEEIASDFLKRKGYAILDTNFSSRYGEIDVIAEHEDEMIFVEVKTRTHWKQMVSGEESVSFLKRERMQKTIQIYFQKKGIEFEIPWRCDVIVIEIHKRHYRLIHYPYAFEISLR